jgi:uncharacterized protein YndB with AHSA1/START domain
VAVVARMIDAPPADVFAVLGNGWYYSNWVVGTSHMRAVEADWPAVGSRLHHASGAWPLVTRDETVVEVMVPDRTLVLLARGRPFGEARVMLELRADGAGTQVTMTETPVSGPGKWLHNPATEHLLRARNVEALARLAAICEHLTEPRE